MSVSSTDIIGAGVVELAAVEVVALEELAHDVGAEREGHAAVVLSPAHNVLVGVGPQQVAEQARVGHVRGAHEALDLLHLAELGGQAAVHAEDLLVHDGRHGQAVEAVREGLPELDVVAALALVVEAVDAVDGRALVVAAQDEEVLRVLDLVGQQQADGLQALFAAVHVVSAGKQQATNKCSWRPGGSRRTRTDAAGRSTGRGCRLRTGKTASERLDAALLLLHSGERTADLDGRLQLHQNGLRQEHLARVQAQPADLRLRQVHLLAGARAAHAQQLLDNAVHVDGLQSGRRHGCSRLAASFSPPSSVWARAPVSSPPSPPGWVARGRAIGQ
ncbi:hypothetical protein ON010_g17552 [Phytophthora cinnamomi]|nr:hypothetical protein ON010_g17552 [Phytophthora cinnamomi]